MTTACQPVKKFPAFDETRSCSLVLPTAQKVSIPWARLNQSTPFSANSQISMVVLCSYLLLCLPIGPFLLIPSQKSCTVFVCYDRMTVHRNRFLVNEANKCTKFQFYWYYYYNNINTNKTGIQCICWILYCLLFHKHVTRLVRLFLIVLNMQ